MSLIPVFTCQPASRGVYAKLVRIKHGLRQKDIAKLADIPPSYVSVAEADKYIPWWARKQMEAALAKLEEGKSK